MTVRDQLLGGRYRLVRQLGEGGMGQVWEAQDETLGRPVAAKVISLLAGGGSLGGEARARFLREARITAQLQHPNTVTVHDFGETGAGNEQVPFLVMELVRGEGLDAKLRQGAVSLPDAARWGAQIGDALADAHDAGIMHRDIKPSNILITPSGNVKVLDFGIARAADPYATADRLTQTGFIVGTPPYMAPEQARGYPEPRSDLYALGCLLFELITGQLPFQAPDTLGYLTAHLTQEPPAPSSVSTNIPPAWDNLVLTLLHKDPAQRYPNAADLSQALRQLERAQEPESPAGHEARNILLARMARAMSASLARRAALSQNTGGNGAVQITQSQAKTTVQMAPTAPLVPFDMSWSGRESQQRARNAGHNIALTRNRWATGEPAEPREEPTARDQAVHEPPTKAFWKRRTVVGVAAPLLLAAVVTLPYVLSQDRGNAEQQSPTSSSARPSTTPSLSPTPSASSTPSASPSPKATEWYAAVPDICAKLVSRARKIIPEMDGDGTEDKPVENFDDLTESRRCHWSTEGAMVDHPYYADLYVDMFQFSSGLNVSTAFEKERGYYEERGESCEKPIHDYADELCVRNLNGKDFWYVTVIFRIDNLLVTVTYEMQSNGSPALAVARSRGLDMAKYVYGLVTAAS
ncbi:serine/threonine-protein kinase [Streptomyces sp. NPDC056308]|uniref:serine/threonine-protein kinase n=1 Tax=Streptomyces sp. NPDC056308 TaxID=3345780 RepID=UPI0035E2324D